MTVASFLVLSAVHAGAALPPECAQPKLRDVRALKQLSTEDGSLSMALDSVATWCFDGEGKFNAGWRKSAREGPSPDCGRAIVACEKALELVKKSAAVRALATEALGDLEQPYLEARYSPKRAGIRDRPSEEANCHARARSELFAQAQAWMERSRLHAQIQSEYGDYRSWLYARGLVCQNLVAEARRKGTRVDFGTEAPRPVEPPSTPTAAKPLPQKWKELAERTAAQEADADFKKSFLASKEAKGCNCPRVNPGAIHRALETKEGGEAGLALLQAEDAANTQCAHCYLDAYVGWKQRSTKLCEAMPTLSEVELNKLEMSDEGAGVPQRCFDQARDARAATQRLSTRPLPPPAPLDEKPPPSVTAPAVVVAPAPAPKGLAPTSSSNLVTVGGLTYYRPPDAGVPQAPPASSAQVVSVPAALPSGSVVAPAARYDAFVPPQSYAPIISREEGRLYVRINMSSACVAEILPGPIQARNGDLLVVPVGARSIDVKSPCGGIAEIYFGKEPRPRFSEVFARNQPVSFEFRPQ
ncbi:MAG: hypothetical protein ACOZIN_15520 [Myxococcota bacterium]